MRATRFHIVTAMILLLGIAQSSKSDAAAIYGVTPLSPPGVSFSPRQVNDLREVVGNLNVATPSPKPALWLPQPKYGLAAGVNDLSTQPGFDRDLTAGINNLGQIVGSGHGTPGSGSDAPTVWLPSAAYGRAAGWSVVDPVFGSGSRINDAGEMAGHYHNLEAAAVWLPAPAHGLPAGRSGIPTPGWGFANDINAAGQVAGQDFDFAAGTTRPFLCLPEAAYGRTAGVHFVTGIGIGGGATNADSIAVNNAGHLVGTYTTPNVNGVGTSRAYIWRPNTTVDGGPAGFFDLGGVPADATYWSIGAADINDLGQVVGTRSFKTDAMAISASNAFLWTRTGGMVDLNTLIDPGGAGAGWVLQNAISINAAGDIVGTGRFNGTPMAYLLTVPEPSACAAMAALAGAALRRRRC